MPAYAIPAAARLSRRRPGDPKRRRVVIVANPGAGSLEYIGPLQVFNEANFFLRYWELEEFGYDVEVVSTGPGPVYSNNGLTIRADTAYDGVRGKVDTLMFQAVGEDEDCLRDERFLAWVSKMSSRVRRIASICVGTYILAEAGVLKGRRATTHWLASEDFRKRYPDVTLDPDPIYIKDEHVYTSAGSTSGFDLAVAFVEEDFGEELARRVAQGLVMFLKRPGNQAQFSVHVSSRFPEGDKLQEVQTYVLENLGDDLSVESLAAKAGMSPRNFSRVFQREVGVSPGRFVEDARLEGARRWLEKSGAQVGEIAGRCGYRTADGLRLAFERNLGVSPREYRQRFSSSRAV